MLAAATDFQAAPAPAPAPVPSEETVAFTLVSELLSSAPNAPKTSIVDCVRNSLLVSDHLLC
jgi:hypothetical protein